jgi:hypothetical protein
LTSALAAACNEADLVVVFHSRNVTSRTTPSSDCTWYHDGNPMFVAHRKVLEMVANRMKWSAPE